MFVNNHPQLSVEQAQACVPDKTALYMALQRNQYVMPPLKD